MADQKSGTQPRSYLRTGNQQQGTPVPGAGRTDGRLRRGDEMIPQKRRP
ncbi:hypothetical protein [Streptomyces phaeochromogenes]